MDAVDFNWFGFGLFLVDCVFGMGTEHFYCFKYHGSFIAQLIPTSIDSFYYKPRFTVQIRKICIGFSAKGTPAKELDVCQACIL